MVGGQRPLHRIDRDQRDARRAMLAQVARISTGIPMVVVPDRFLFDGDRRDVGERGSPVIRPLQVLQEGQRNVAVVHDRRLDAFHEVHHDRILEASHRQVVAGPGGREVGPDQGVQAGGREIGVGFAQAERTPLGMSHPTPSCRVAREREEVRPAKLLRRPTQGHGHRLGHGDHERAEGDV